MRLRPFVFLGILCLFTSPLAGHVLPASPPVAYAAPAACDCSGNYVNPAATSPSVATPQEGSTSPTGSYTLSVTGSSLTVQDKHSGKTLLSLTGMQAAFHAGFSPNDSGFAVWSLGSTGGHVALYDLSSKTPSNVVWSNDYLGPYSVGFSPHGTYFLVSAPANSQFTQVKVVNAVTGTSVYDDQVPGNTNWGFSPDDDRLAIWTGNNSSASSTSTIILYDLVAQRRVWSSDGAFGSVSVAFSPHGTYLASAAITNGSHADLAVVPAAANTGSNSPVYQASFDLYAPPGKDKDKFGSAAWGFSPDKGDATFVYDALNGSTGVSVVMVNLAARSSHAFSYPNLVAGWWQFSPCGDVLGIVVQPGTAASVDVGLYDSSSGQALATDQFASLSVSLKATSTYHVATVDGTDHNLARNAGHSSCSSGGGNGSGSGGNSGGGSSGGSGTGGGAGGFPPCPQCYKPPVALDGLQVSPIAVIGGGALTGTVTSSTGGAVSLSSSDPTVVSVPAVLDTTSGATTFDLTTLQVTTDTVVTITATAGGTVKTATFIVEAACSPAVSSFGISPIVAAPIAGGGGPGGAPRGPQFSVAQISVAPLVIASGSTATGTLSLTDAANRDTEFALVSSDSAAVSIPASVIVTKGQTTAQFPVTGQNVTSDVLVTVRAHAPGYVAQAATIAVMTPPSLDSVVVAPSRVVGGTTVTGTVTLSGASAECQTETVDLTSSDSSVASVPASVTVPPGAGSATFTVATSAVTADTAVTIGGSLNGSTRSATLTVQAATSRFNDNFVDAATLQLPGIATGDTNEATMEAGEPLLSDTCAVLSAHQMEKSVWFKLTASQSGVLTVSTANQGTNFDSVLALYADPGSGGVSSLSTPVGCDNNADALRSTNSSDIDQVLQSEEHTGPNAGTLGGLPTWSSIMHVSVVAGQTYYLQLGGVGGAPAGHYVLTAEINPNIPLPDVLQSVSVDQATLTGGGAATGTVTLSEPAPVGGVIVALHSSDAASASVPDSVIVPEGADGATFPVSAGAVSSDTPVTVTASFDGRQESANLTVTAS